MTDTQIMYEALRDEGFTPERIFASKENVVIPADEAAEMAPIRPELGEFRAHYAGFFDPGFGVAPNEGRAVLDRAHGLVTELPVSAGTHDSRLDFYSFLV